eukprot:5661738-Prymnesium_polylepis.2
MGTGISLCWGAGRTRPPRSGRWTADSRSASNITAPRVSCLTAANPELTRSRPVLAGHAQGRCARGADD